MEVGKAGDQRLSVVGLELVDLGAVDQASDHFADVVVASSVGRQHAVEFGGIEGRLARLARRDATVFTD